MMPTILLIGMRGVSSRFARESIFQDEFHYFAKGFCDQARARYLRVTGDLVTEKDRGLDSSPDSRLGIGRFIPDHVTLFKFNPQFAGCLEKHTRVWFPPCRSVGWGIRTEIGGIDDAGIETSFEFVLDRPEIFFRKVSSPDPALVGDNNNLKTGLFQFRKKLANAFQKFDLAGLGTVTHVLYQGSVPIKKDCSLGAGRSPIHFSDESSPVAHPA